MLPGREHLNISYGGKIIMLCPLLPISRRWISPRPSFLSTSASQTRTPTPLPTHPSADAEDVRRRSLRHWTRTERPHVCPTLVTGAEDAHNVYRPPSTTSPHVRAPLGVTL
ncbi:hypothetical protein B0H17DRAFT_425950 [Mycena rosella]|uniref:Uncharacterized protein n=1 Tax=Mycena rosella TaxID=1033263 RepID=A0AAD7DNS1_MYCRO|nr:hypothetical protein B0H17DRAFT_425950 [Mycena rosella]